MLKHFGVLVPTISVLLSFYGVANAASTVRPDNNRIVGGRDARNVDIPYIISLTWFDWHLCGGSIVNERTVITAAHCLVNRAPTAGLKVHAGTKSRSLDEGVVVQVEAVHVHPLYNHTTQDFDIGLVRLEHPLSFGYSIKPIRLPLADQPLEDNSVAMVAGWGLTKAGGGQSDLPEILRYALVPVVSQNVCRQLPKYHITERMLCAGYLKLGGIDACQADSGGPLVYNDELIGIVSWGFGCALPDNPGVYARVAVFRPWVDDILSVVYNEALDGRELAEYS